MSSQLHPLKFGLSCVYECNVGILLRTGKTSYAGLESRISFVSFRRMPP